MCPPHCDVDHRSDVHWPAPDLALSETLTVGAAGITLALAAIGTAFAVGGVVAWSRRRGAMPSATLWAAVWMSLTSGVLWSAYGAVSAYGASNHWSEWSVCWAHFPSDDLVLWPGVAGLVLPFVAYRWLTRRSRFVLAVEREVDGPTTYREAPPARLRLADPVRADRLVNRALTMRVALALATSGFVAELGYGWWWGLPYTPNLFAMTAMVAIVMAANLPTERARRAPVARALAAQIGKTRSRRRSLKIAFGWSQRP